MYCLVCFFSFLPVLAPISLAQIGSTVEDFRKSQLVKHEGFSDHGSYELKDDPVFKGKYAYNFMSADKRYRIQLITEKRGGRIVFQYLFYDSTDDVIQSLKDGSVTLAFVSESSAAAVNLEQYISLVAEANRGDRNSKYTRNIDGYMVSVIRYQGPVINGWSIGLSM